MHLEINSWNKEKPTDVIYSSYDITMSASNFKLGIPTR